MAASNQGTKFRRVSSNKNRARSASSDNILPPSYPAVMSYDVMKQYNERQVKVHRNSSSSQGGSFNPLQAEGGVRFSAYSITGATSLDSVNPEDYDRHSETHTLPYTHSHSGGPTRWRRRQSDGVTHQHNRRSLNLPPPPPLVSSSGHHGILDSSRESFQSGRGLGSYNRQLQLRDSMSQDTMGERDFDYQCRYNSTTLPTLSLQDSYHTRDHHHMRSSGSRERSVPSNDRDLRRGVQEFDVMPIHEAFTHRAMVTTTGPGLPAAHLSPHSPPHTSSPQENRGGNDGTAIDRQPLATSTTVVESQHNQLSPHNDIQTGPSSGTIQQQQLPQTYHPVFFSPESHQLYMNVDGIYKPLPSRYSYHHISDSIDGDRRASLNQSDQRLSVIESSGRQTSSSYGISVPYDYYHCSVFMMLVYMFCLNIIVVLLFSLPAIWFAKRAMRAKYEGDYAGTLSLGTKALCFNIVGGCVHILFLCALIFIPILLQFVFDAI